MSFVKRLPNDFFFVKIEVNLYCILVKKFDQSNRGLFAELLKFDPVLSSSFRDCEFGS